MNPVRALRALAIVLVSMFGAGAAAAPPALELAQLMAALAKVERSTVAFEETRHFAVLSVPVVRRGTLSYVRPDQLVMEVVTPFPETIDIVGSRIRVQTPDARREWNLAGQPVALAWIEAIRASLAGDEAALAHRFNVALTGNLAAWEMRLVPTNARVAAALRGVTVRGREARLLSIEIVDAQRDRIVIALKPVAGSAP